MGPARSASATNVLVTGTHRSIQRAAVASAGAPSSRRSTTTTRGGNWLPRSGARSSHPLGPRALGCRHGMPIRLSAVRCGRRPVLLPSWRPRHRCHSAAAPKAPSVTETPPKALDRIQLAGRDYALDRAWFNVPPNILQATQRRLHLERDHPIYITRQIIESHFPPPTYRTYNDYSPVVSTHQNFDSLGFPSDHPGRAPSDTYYINQTTLLRTHTSAHQADTFRADESPGYLISADVYRRDAIDRSHYPVFHQMEGARSWDRTMAAPRRIHETIRDDAQQLPQHDAHVADPNPPFHPERNPLQDGHSPAEVEAVAMHLKRSLEIMVADVFSRARAAATAPTAAEEPLRMRWVEAFFPFTSPSWELEVYYAGDWLEVLGCGIVKQSLYSNAGVPSKLGWAFGIGIDRIAMLLFQIPDIRLFWSRDERFLSQFRGLSANLEALRPFVPFSKHPPCPKDVSFWLPEAVSGGNGGIHQNDVMELVRTVAGNAVEDVKLIDEFTHPKSGRRSMAYRIVYRSLEGTLTNIQANEFHERLRQALVAKLGVELR